jgi:hypothetical protein
MNLRTGGRIRHVIGIAHTRVNPLPFLICRIEYSDGCVADAPVRWDAVIPDDSKRYRYVTEQMSIYLAQNGNRPSVLRDWVPYHGYGYRRLNWNVSE